MTHDVGALWSAVASNRTPELRQRHGYPLRMLVFAITGQIGGTSALPCAIRLENHLDGNNGACLLQDLQSCVCEAAARVAEEFAVDTAQSTVLAESLETGLRGPVAQPVAVARTAHPRVLDNLQTHMRGALEITSARRASTAGQGVSKLLRATNLRRDA
ncbi:MAG: hypothetical protein ACLFTT_14275 [Candidatus Hydrogenedentota bacterium]